MWGTLNVVDGGELWRILLQLPTDTPTATQTPMTLRPRHQRQPYANFYRYSNRHAYKHTHGYRDANTNRHPDGYTHQHSNRYTDKFTDANAY